MTKSTDNNNKIKQPKITENLILCGIENTRPDDDTCNKSKLFDKFNRNEEKTHRRNETIENFIIMDSHEYDRLLLACLSDIKIAIFLRAQKSHTFIASTSKTTT